jgi:hypothetical protein
MRKSKQIETIKRRLRKELKLQHDAWDYHNKKWNCKTDGTCLERAHFQGRTEVLEFVLELLKGETPDELRID